MGSQVIAKRHTVDNRLRRAVGKLGKHGQAIVDKFNTFSKK